METTRERVTLVDLASRIPEVDSGTRRHLASLSVGQTIAIAILIVIGGTVVVAAAYAGLTYPTAPIGQTEVDRQAAALLHEAWMKSVLVFLRPIDVLAPVVSALLGYMFGAQRSARSED